MSDSDIIRHYEVRVPGELAILFTEKISVAHSTAKKHNAQVKDRKDRARVFGRTMEGFVVGPIKEEKKA
jgi:hypothetical protein